MRLFPGGCEGSEMGNAPVRAKDHGRIRTTESSRLLHSLTPGSQFSLVKRLVSSTIVLSVVAQLS